jgi:DNA-binding protein HU-beta
MNKKEFIALFTERGNFETKAEAERKLMAFLATVEETLVSGEEVNFIGWGKWEVKEKAARTGRNPQTGKKIKIPAKKVVSFKVGKKLAEKVDK